MQDANAVLWDKETFLERLRAVGMTRYHHLHPFHQVMNSGQSHARTTARLGGKSLLLSAEHPDQRRRHPLQLSPARSAPRLDFIASTTTTERAKARAALRRGCAWEAVGLSREEMWEERHILPGVRFAVDAYVHFCREKPWPIAIASSMTELFAPDLMSERLAAFEKYYAWVPSWGLDYFRSRVTQARVDIDRRLRVDRDLLRHPRPARGGRSRALVQVRSAVGHAGRDAPGLRLRGTRMSAPTDSLSPETILRLAAGVRMQTDKVSVAPVLLYRRASCGSTRPGSSSSSCVTEVARLRRLSRCLPNDFKATPETLSADTTAYLQRLRDRGLLETVNSPSPLAGEGLGRGYSPDARTERHNQRQGCRRKPVAHAAPGRSSRVAPRPFGLLAELTYRCPLHCPYCSNPTQYPPTQAELTTDEWRRGPGGKRTRRAASASFGRRTAAAPRSGRDRRGGARRGSIPTSLPAPSA